MEAGYAGFPLSVNLSSFSSARCVTCVCPYVRSLANAIAMQLRNSNVNSCGLLPKQAKQAPNFSLRKVSFSLHNEHSELNIAHILMPNASFLLLTKLVDIQVVHCRFIGSMRWPLRCLLPRSSPHCIGNAQRRRPVKVPESRNQFPPSLALAVPDQTVLVSFRPGRGASEGHASKEWEGGLQFSTSLFSSSLDLVL